MDSSLIIEILNIIGIVAFAISGTLSAQYKKMDLFGIIVVANITAIGGGTLRDVLINNHPIVWIKDPSCLFIGTAAAIITLFINRSSKHFLKILISLDAVGLAVFIVIGIRICPPGTTPFIASMMGVLTGIGGGILRDILCSEVPLVLQKEIYATAAIFGAIIYFGCLHFQLGINIAISVSIIATLTLRLCSVYRGWSLPRVGT